MSWIPEASTSAARADLVFFAILALSAAFLVGITTVMIVFVIRYGRARHPEPEVVKPNPLLEITWTVVPLVLFLGMFYFGWTNFAFTRNPPRDAMVVEVVGRQWAWGFEYPNGRKTTELYAPLGRPMKLEIASSDVVHGFYVPAFRLKMDAVPGRVTTTWFEATRLGAWDIECTVICGVDHSLMLSKVVVVPEEEFKAWYFGPADGPPPGQAFLAATRSGAVPPIERPGEPAGLTALRRRDCLKCHSVDGRAMVGPTFRGIFESRDRVVAKGGEEREIVRDETYLRRAIQEPGAEIVKGYPPVMPVVPLPEGELRQVIDYLKGLR